VVLERLESLQRPVLEAYGMTDQPQMTSITAAHPTRPARLAMWMGGAAIMDAAGAAGGRRARRVVIAGQM
jgi:hypothetical protein